MNFIDFRSDTVTKPSAGMLHAMMNAAVGDDVFSEDPSINLLEEKAADLFGMEAGLFCPSGTMTNQIAIKMHTQPGDEVICDFLSHVYQYEGGGIAFNSGASVRLLNGDRGRLNAKQVQDAININDIHKAHTSLVVLENTINKGGGSCYELSDIEAIQQVCIENNLQLHLDGARLFNALVYKKQSATDYGRLFHSISICLSKGLGCPVGSVLLGTKKDITRSRRIRKVLGGGMRQAGVVAAAGIYALDHHIERLQEDHLHAKKIEQALLINKKVESVILVETNIILFTVRPEVNTKEFITQLKNKGILAFDTGAKQIRFVLHLNISKEMVEKTIEILSDL